jgi:hydrogenase maturation protease
MEKITILGIGNIIMQDEGIGVRAIEQLDEMYHFPNHVQLLDGGCLGMELLPFLDETAKLLIVDAMEARTSPGVCQRVAGDEVRQYFRQKLSVHEIGISEILASMEITERAIGEVVIIGMQPETIDVGLDLSETAHANMPELLRLVIEQLGAWHITPTCKGEVA